LIWAALLAPLIIGPALMFGFGAGLAILPLWSAYRAAIPANVRCSLLVSSIAANWVVAVALLLVIYGVTRSQMMGEKEQLWLIVVLAAGVASTAIWLLFREVLELFTEFLIWPFYRIRGYGPGLDDFPLQGPAVVVANHSAWLDPVWIAKVLPRRITPMMTSVFYDKPILRWLMVNVVHAIRVEASEFRREAPELFKLVEERRREMIQRYFGRIFAEGRKSGIIRKDISGDLIIEILLGAVQAIMNPAKMEALGLEPKTGYSAIISVILDGVVNKKGRSR